jgi:D-glycero-D-manno-heptose 1,7-bisphosphate phosphatase
MRGSGGTDVGSSGVHGAPIRAILFDRDGTLVVNVPHNTDPARVVPMPTARESVELVRRRGVPMAVVSNQSAIGRGFATVGDVELTNARVEELLGPIGPFLFCPHMPDDGCSCRKPQPGLLLEAARQLGVEIECVAFVGDMASDMAAASAAGARGVLVPTAETPAAEVAAAQEVAPSLLAAVELLLN